MPKVHTNPFSMLYQNLQQRKALACSPAHDALPLWNLLKKYFLRKGIPERQQNIFYFITTLNCADQSY